MIRRLPLYFLAVFLCYSTSYAQPQTGDVHYFVNSNDVRRIVRDGDNLWLASYGGGLIKYNTVTGSKTQYLRTNSNITSNLLKDVAIAGDGKIWIATNNSGVASFDGVNWVTYTKEKDGLLSNSTSSLVIDRNGTVWVGSPRGGVMKFDGVKWTAFTPPQLPDTNVTALAVDSNGTVWVGFWQNKIATFGRIVNDIYSNDNQDGSGGMQKSSILAIEVDRPGAVWIGSTANRLYRFFDNSWDWRGIQVGLPDSIYYMDLAVKGMTASPTGGIWATTPYTIFHIDTNDAFDVVVVHDVTSEFLYSRNGMVDVSGTPWFGSSKALCEYNGTVITEHSITNTGLNTNNVRSMKLAPNGTIWFNANGVCSYQDGIWSKPAIEYDPVNPPLYPLYDDYASDFILKGDDLSCILLDFNGMIKFDMPYSKFFQGGLDTNEPLSTYIGIDGGDSIYIVKRPTFTFQSWGLSTFDGRKFTDYSTHNDSSEIRNVSDILFDKEHTLWFSQWDRGIVKYNNVAGWNKYDPLAETLPFYSVWDIELDSNGTVWAAADSGLIKYNKSTDGWELFSIPTSVSTTSRLRTLAVESDTSIYVFTEDRNLLHFDGSLWTKYGNENYPWPESSVNGMVIDKLGNIWMRTNGEGALVYRKGGPVLDVKREYQKGSTLSLTIYPSPAQDHISIQLPEGVRARSVSIIDILGREVMTADITNEPISVSSLPSGYYKVICSSGDGLISGSFVK